MHSPRFLAKYFVLILLLAWPIGPALGQSATATGVSRAFNPAISANTLLTGRVAAETNDRAYNGIDLQESEIQLTSHVDPYWKANLVFAVHPAHDEEADTDTHAHGYVGDVEVATVAGQAIPGGFGLVLGKDYLPFGKHAALHTHQFPFVDAPAAVATFLGDHSLSETGVRLAHDLPVPWYSDVTAYAVDGKSEIFDGESRDLALGTRWSNAFDLNREATLELGGSWLHGRVAPHYLLIHPDEDLGGALDIYGADLTWKWISSGRSKGPALTVTGEVILPRPSEGAGDPLGWYALLQYRFARNWWIGTTIGGLDRDLPVSVDEVGTGEPADEEHAHGLYAWEEVFEYKANLTWAPSEFSFVRLEAARYEDPSGDRSESVIALQLNFTIGSHPAHSY